MKLHKEIPVVWGKVARPTVLLVLLALIAALSIGLDRGQARAAPSLVGSIQAAPVAISLEPSLTEVLEDQSFTVDIMVDAGVQKISGVQAFLDFDPVLLQVVDADPVIDGIQIQRGSTLTVRLTNSADNVLGQIDYAAGNLSEPPSGAFVLATVTFRATAQTLGTDINLTSLPPRNTFADFLGDPLPTNVSGAGVVITGIADLAVTKNVSNSTPNEGDIITYTILVVNNGPSDATGVEVIDNLPAGVTFVSDGGAGAFDPDTGVWLVGGLAGGTSPPPAIGRLNILVQVDSGTGGTTITNIASVGGDQADPEPGNNEFGVSIRVQLSDLSLEKSADVVEVKPGQLVNYTVDVTNNGPSEATGVEVIDHLPEHVSHVSDDGSGAFDPDTGIWSVGSLPAGSTATLKIVVQVESVAGGTTITNNASVTGDQADPKPGNNQDNATVAVPLADLALIKNANFAEAFQGQIVEYTVTATNNGPSGATGAQVTDKLPVEVTYFADDSGGLFNPDTGIWLVGSLPAGFSDTLTILAKLTGGAVRSSVTNIASVTGDQDDPDPDNDSASATILALGDGGPEMFIHPEVSVVGLGQLFKVQIKVNPKGQQVAGVQAFLGFDPTRLRVQDAIGGKPGVQIQDGGVLVDFLTLNSANNLLGQIDYAAGNLSGGSPFPTKEFVLATIEFEALALTEGIPTFVTVSNAPAARKTKVSDPSGQDITGVKNGGIIEIITAVNLRLNFRLQGGARPGPQGWEQPIIAQLLNTDTGQTRVVLATSKFDAINGQAFVVASVLPVGVYDIMITGPSTLSNVKRGFNVDLGVGEVDLGVLLSGNAEVADTPNIIDIQDFGLLAAAFGAQEGEPRFDPRVDFDANKVINISDFGLLVRNFLKQGPVEIR